MSAEPRGAAPRRSARDWFVDLTCIAAVLILGLLIYVGETNVWAPTTALAVLDIVGGTLSCAALWWRRRWPFEIGLVTAVASAGSKLSTLAALIMLFTVALHRNTKSLVIVAAANLAATAILTVWQPDPATDVRLDITFSALGMIAVIAWGMFLRARRQLVLSLQERAERAEAEQQWRFDQGRQLERSRIAREMHDVLGHRISLISMHAGALELRAGSAEDDVAESAAIIRASAHQALQDLREVIGILRTEPDDDVSERPQPTLEDVPTLIRESQRAGMHITLQFQVDQTAGDTPASVGRTAYRVVQEGLTNARKHAPGAAVLVQVNGRPGPGLSVELRTRLPIRPPSAADPPTGGQGLLGLAERAELVGGRCEHSRAPDGDFLLQCWLPWSAWRLPEPQSSTF